jgi:hypothetical protein
MGSQMTSVHHCLPDVLADLLHRQPLSPGKVAFAWRASVGPTVDRATHVTLSEQGELRVIAIDHHWRDAVERSRELVMNRLTRLLGPDVVRRLAVVVGPGAR